MATAKNWIQKKRHRKRTQNRLADKQPRSKLIMGVSKGYIQYTIHNPNNPTTADLENNK